MTQRNAVETLRAAAEDVCRRLESETDSVTIIEQVSLRQALDGLSSAAHSPVGVMDEGVRAAQQLMAVETGGLRGAR